MPQSVLVADLQTVSCRREQACRCVTPTGLERPGRDRRVRDAAEAAVHAGRAGAAGGVVAGRARLALLIFGTGGGHAVSGHTLAGRDARLVRRARVLVGGA